jgi:hypothetical protein
LDRAVLADRPYVAAPVEQPKWRSSSVGRFGLKNSRGAEEKHENLRQSIHLFVPL